MFKGDYCERREKTYAEGHNWEGGRMTNLCSYCETELKKSQTGGWEVCHCPSANIEWKICIEMQQLKKRLDELGKELSKLKEGASKKTNRKVEK